jgi:hypothetical protein
MNSMKRWIPLQDLACYGHEHTDTITFHPLIP